MKHACFGNSNTGPEIDRPYVLKILIRWGSVRGAFGVRSGSVRGLWNILYYSIIYNAKHFLHCHNLNKLNLFVRFWVVTSSEMPAAQADLV